MSSVMNQESKTSKYVFRVYVDDDEPYEYNDYTIQYYLNLKDALKKQYRVQLQIDLDDNDFYHTWCAIEYIKVIG